MDSQRPNAIILLGGMAAGKTTLGQKLAAHLEIPFIDADMQLQARYGQAAEVMIAAQGMAYFRAQEARILAHILAQPGPYILATGGGVVEQACNCQQLVRHASYKLHLAVTPEMQWLRISQSPERQLACTRLSLPALRVMQSVRRPKYERLSQGGIDASTHAETQVFGLALLLLAQDVS